MVALIERDETIIATPNKTITWDEGEVAVRIFGHTLFWRRVRRSWTLRALPLGELRDIQREVRINATLGLEDQVRCIAGARAARAPLAIQQAIYEAFWEVNDPSPKATTSPAVSPSPTAPSSDDSAPSTASPSEKSSANADAGGTDS